MNRSLCLHIKTGFTLVELMMVIAIVGVLASVVLASLNNSRIKGVDAAIKTDMIGIRSATELYYSSQSTPGYGTQAFTADCGGSVAGVFNDTTVQNYIDDAIARSGQTANTAAKCVAGGTSYVIAVQFKSSASSGWCVDSVGNSKLITWANFANGDTDCIAAGS